MQRIGVRELRQHASRYLALVKAGETVEVTERGQLVALLAPPGQNAVDRERLLAAGVIVPAVGPQPRRRPRPVPLGDGEPGNAELLDDERTDRL